MESVSGIVAETRKHIVFWHWLACSRNNTAFRMLLGEESNWYSIVQRGKWAVISPYKYRRENDRESEHQNTMT